MIYDRIFNKCHVFMSRLFCRFHGLLLRHVMYKFVTDVLTTSLSFPKISSVSKEKGCPNVGRGRCPRPWSGASLSFVFRYTILSRILRIRRRLSPRKCRKPSCPRLFVHLRKLRRHTLPCPTKYRCLRAPVPRSS